MIIEAIQSVQATTHTAPGAQPVATGFGSFLDKMEGQQVEVQNRLAAYINGTSPLSAHEIMLDIERNRLMLSLALQVRNKIVEGVQELYRTQI